MVSEHVNEWINMEKNPVKKFFKKIIRKCLAPVLLDIEEEKIHGQETDNKFRIIGQQIDNLEKLYQEVEYLKQEKARLEERCNSFLFKQDDLNAEIEKILNHINDDYGNIDYLDFEENFRGSREDIKNRQTIYLPYFEGKSNVYDLGCGRGEFVELMTENNIGVIGVDLYQEFVNYCQGLGLNVHHGDAIEELQRAEKVDGIFLGQVVEHLPLKTVIAILETAYKKLEDGGYLIAETPNPLSLAIFTQSFYIDPTHNKPVHPYLLRYLAQKAGFQSVELLFTEKSRYPETIPEIQGEVTEEFNRSMHVVSDFLFGSQDYALIARK